MYLRTITEEAIVPINGHTTNAAAVMDIKDTDAATRTKTAANPAADAKQLLRSANNALRTSADMLNAGT